jgi:type IV secretory pathway component VirB8
MITKIWKPHTSALHTGAPVEASVAHAFEDELFFTLRQQRNNWAMVAVGSVGLALLALSCLIAILPLSQSKPFVVMVDKTTGEAEKIVEVRPATLDQQDVVRQAELVSYIVDRETYDPADNPVRIPDVMGRSSGNAAETLAELWNANSPQYPATIYGADVRVRVVVKSISFDPAGGRMGDVARVRITKTREEKGAPPVDRSFIVTIGYAFQPQQDATLATVWHNPLGFTVISYRIDAETAG